MPSGKRRGGKEFKQFLVKRKRSIVDNTTTMCSINESRKLIFLVNEESSCGNILKLNTICWGIFNITVI